MNCTNSLKFVRFWLHNKAAVKVFSHKAEPSYATRAGQFLSSLSNKSYQWAVMSKKYILTRSFICYTAKLDDNLLLNNNKWAIPSPQTCSTPLLQMSHKQPPTSTSQHQHSAQHHHQSQHQHAQHLGSPFSSLLGSGVGVGGASYLLAPPGSAAANHLFWNSRYGGDAIDTLPPLPLQLQLPDSPAGSAGSSASSGSGSAASAGSWMCI